VLSDSSERAWYDSHKNEILGRQDDSTETAQVEKSQKINLWSYFSSCYSGYGDDPGGFYAIYDNLFHNIIWGDEEIEGEPVPPRFGTSSSEWNDVEKFYNYWSSYVTNKNFNWADEFNPNTAPSRKVKRLMEQANKKERDKYRREWNEQVRQLVSFVKKRDKRVIAHQAEIAKQKEEEEARKKELQAKKEKEWKKVHLESQTEQWKKLDNENQDYFAALDQEMEKRSLGRKKRRSHRRLLLSSLSKSISFSKTMGKSRKVKKTSTNCCHTSGDVAR